MAFRQPSSNQYKNASFIGKQGVKTYFVVADGQEPDDAPEEFKLAYARCEEKNINPEPEWISESDCRRIKLTNTVVIILQNFDYTNPDGIFSYLKKSRAMVLGPRCVLQCLMKGEPTPTGSAPVYNLTMKGISVCLSGFRAAHKENLQFKIESMGGRLIRDFTEAVTHLVVSKVTGATTAKYSIAAERKTPVMLEQWIHECWDTSLKRNIHALEEPFASLTCPPFLNLKISSSQVSKTRKDNLKRIIESKGGQYFPSLAEGETNVLVIGVASGDKFVHAKKWGIPCVSEEWVTRSAECGYSLPYKDFGVKAVKCSTPDHDKTFTDPNFSIMSCISGPESKKHVVDDTIIADTSFLEPAPPNNKLSLQQSKRPLSLHPVQEASTINTVSQLRTPEKSRRNDLRDNLDIAAINTDALRQIENISASELKKAGSFLDGCKVYLSGMSPSGMDTVRKVLNRSGATRLDRITEEVSHVLVAGSGLTAEEHKAVKQFEGNLIVVRVEWLLKCIQASRAIAHEPFLCVEKQRDLEPSPLSKKGLQMWHQKSQIEESKSVTAAKKSDMELVKQYIQFEGAHTEMSQDLATPLPEREVETEATENPNEEHNQSIQNVMQNASGPNKIFDGLKFLATGLTKEDIDHCKEIVEKHGGLWQRKPADYAVVNLKGARTKCLAKEVITKLWIQDCDDKIELLPVEYYHKPFDFPQHNKPLAGCVLGASNYVGKERVYLGELGSELGARFQELFAKKKSVERGCEASTHLLCPSASGDKYHAAVKWKLPVVTKDWLLACAEDGQKLDEEAFLLEGSVVAPRTPGAANVSSTRNEISNSIIHPNTPATPVVISSAKKPIVAETSTPLSAVPSRLRKIQTNTEQKSPLEANCSTSLLFTTPDVSKTVVDYKTPNLPLSQKIADNELPKYMTPHTYAKHWDAMSPKHAATVVTPYGVALQSEPTSEDRRAWRKLADDFATAFRSPADNIAEEKPIRKRILNEEISFEEDNSKRQRQNSEVDSFQCEASTRSPLSLSKTVSKSNCNISDPEETLEGAKAAPKRYKFMITGIDESERCELVKIANELGGEAIGTTYDPAVTHLIMSKPVRSEKLLGSIASGKWIVHHKYLIDSYRCKKFLPEDDYEWGNPKSVDKIPLVKGESEGKLASACYRWRSTLQKSQAAGAYENMKALMYGGPRRTEAFVRLIKAGGGQVLDIGSPFTEPGEATHFFYDTNKANDNFSQVVDFDSLNKHNIPILNPIYLFDYLIQNPSPTPEEWRSKHLGSKVS